MLWSDRDMVRLYAAALLVCTGMAVAAAHDMAPAPDFSDARPQRRFEAGRR